MQAIKIITDTKCECVFAVFPTITSEYWGVEIVVACIGSNHSEVTGPLAECAGQVKVEDRHKKDQTRKNGAVMRRALPPDFIP